MQPWGNSIKDGEQHELHYYSWRAYVYGGYSKQGPWRKGTGWHVLVRVDKARIPNKLGLGQFKKLKDAKNATITASMLFLALCLIEDKEPRDMELLD